MVGEKNMTQKLFISAFPKLENKGRYSFRLFSVNFNLILSLM